MTHADDTAIRRDQERDFLIRLLQLGHAPDVEQVLRDALQLMLDIAQADQGYIEVRGDDDPSGAEPRWWIAHEAGDADVARIRAFVSRGIIATTLAGGQTLETPAASADPRFQDRESVQTGRVGAVLCVPIGVADPLGVLYLHRHGRARFDPEVRHFAELFARHAAPAVAAAQVREHADPTAPFRARLAVDALIGSSHAAAAVLRQLSLVAPLDVDVLLTGPSGTGKTLIARLIAQNSRRAKRPYVELNCAALPEALVESELFGAQAGAHSTATRARPGKVEAANGGTLFLDEIGELAPGAQAKLLQLLQDRVYYPLGATQARTADVRVIAATNVDLDERIADGRFRADLYYRLAVMPIRVPGLDERRGDIPALLHSVVASAAARHRLPALPLSPVAVSMATLARWPGHVRQLAHAAESALIRAVGAEADAIQSHHLFPDEAVEAGADPAPTGFQDATRQFQRAFVEQTLVATGWNVSEAARRLGIARSHVYNLVNALGLERS